MSQTQKPIVQMPKILVTRPIAEALVLAEQLTQSGYVVMVEPMIEIVPWFENNLKEPNNGSDPIPDLPIPDLPIPDLNACQGIIFSSANGVKILDSLLSREPSPSKFDTIKNLKIFAVGETTRTAARAIGCNRVEVSDAVHSASDLAREIINRVSPKDGWLLHICGRDLAGDMAGELNASGFTVKRVTIYQAKAAQSLSHSVKTAIDSNAIDSVLFYSARSLMIFEQLIVASGLTNQMGRIKLVCLSKAIAERAKLSYYSVQFAQSPQTESLLPLLRENKTIEKNKNRIVMPSFEK